MVVFDLRAEWGPHTIFVNEGDEGEQMNRYAAT